ncbi:LacI family DNA-binding transcriptional regulator [Pseudomonas silvicola]|nr:LacI family DNA-binding transcriptional regulator [Pseudomonas silvicola]
MSTLVPTMADVAREAGVSTVTVDRVLNKRAPVRPTTEQKVLSAARRLNFALGKVHAIARDDAPPGDSLPARHLAFFLLRRESTFYQALAQALTLASQGHAGVSAHEIHYLDGLTPQQCAEVLLSKGRQCDAIALVSVDHPAINHAVDQLSGMGVRTYALITDLTASTCAGYVGLDNRKAGRTAAWAISRLSRKPGKVGLLLGDHRFLCQELCEISFRSYFRELGTEFQVLDTRLTFEYHHDARKIADQLLAEHPDLVGLYASSGGREAVMDAVRASGRQHEIVVVCHELVESTRRGLVDGVVDLVISLRREESAKALVDLMTRDAQPHPGNGAGSAASVIVPFDLVNAENA